MGCSNALESHHRFIEITHFLHGPKMKGFLLFVHNYVTKTRTRALRKVHWFNVLWIHFWLINMYHSPWSIQAVADAFFIRMRALLCIFIISNVCHKGRFDSSLSSSLSLSSYSILLCLEYLLYSLFQIQLNPMFFVAFNNFPFIVLLFRDSFYFHHSLYLPLYLSHSLTYVPRFPILLWYLEIKRKESIPSLSPSPFRFLFCFSILDSIASLFWAI